MISTACAGVTGEVGDEGWLRGVGIAGGQRGAGRGVEGSVGLWRGKAAVVQAG